MPGLMSAGGASGNFELLKSGALNWSGTNGTSRSASYTFEKSCDFIVFSTSGNRWNDGNQHNISASNAKKFSTAKYQFSHSEDSVGGSTIVGIGKAVKGTTIVIRAYLRADGSQSISVPYSIYAI
jgi:hypothetical protein